MTSFLTALMLSFSQDAATVTFSDRDESTFPGKLLGREKVDIDLSPLKGVAVHRAVFRPGRDESEAFAARDRGATWTVTGSDRPLTLLGPRFTAFDVTDAIKAAVGQGSVSFTMAEFPGYRPASNRLDVPC